MTDTKDIGLDSGKTTEVYTFLSGTGNEKGNGEDPIFDLINVRGKQQSESEENTFVQNNVRQLKQKIKLIDLVVVLLLVSGCVMAQLEDEIQYNHNLPNIENFIDRLNAHNKKQGKHFIHDLTNFDETIEYDITTVSVILRWIILLISYAASLTINSSSNYF